MNLAKRTWAAGAAVAVAVGLAGIPSVAFAADAYDGIEAGDPIEAGKAQYVSDVEWDYVKTGYGKSPMRDYRNLGNADLNKYKMQVAGQQFEKGVGLHVAAELRLNTDNKCNQLLTYVGIDDSGTANNGSFYAKWRFSTTYADGSGAELATVETVQGQVAPLVDIDLTGAQTLTIEALQKEGGNNGGSFADLGEALLNCTGEQMAFPVRFYSRTDLERLSPGSELTFEVYDAAPNTPVKVYINGEFVAEVMARDDGSTPVIFSLPANYDQTSVEFTIEASDGVGDAHSGAFTGKVTIPNTGSYYVDCSAPDMGVGTEESPFNSVDPVNAMGTFDPGAGIYFKKGVACDGSLHLYGGGSEDARNVITGYGDGDELPVLNGNGDTNTIELVDTNYWTIEGMHIKNSASLVKDTERQGIMVRSLSEAPKNSIVINGNVIDDVAGWPNKTGNSPAYRNSGAIVIMADHELSGPNPGLTNGITITNNKITDVGGGGIKLQGDGQRNNKNLFHENVYIAHNEIQDVGGDAIVVHASKDAIIEHNTGINLGQGKYPFQAGNFAGIWGMTSSNLLFRYNVVGNSTDTAYDSTAWDCDWGMVGASCTFEYNYSYNNSGGAYLDCISGCGNASTNTEAIIRYNVMQDDCRLAGASGGPAHTWIYNNTFYCPTRTFVDHMEGPRTVFNNIFVASEAEWDARWSGSSERVYKNNAYFGGLEAPKAEQGGIVDVDPMIFAAGSSHETFNVDGYKLAAGSPLIGKGLDLHPTGRPFDGKDIFGDAVVGGGNIGAYAGPGVEVRPLTWDEAVNTTSLAHQSNRRTGGVEFTDQVSAPGNADKLGRGRDAYLAEKLDVASGDEVKVGDFTFTWDPYFEGTPDSVKATGQTVELGQGGKTLTYVGFSTGDSKGGVATINYADGSTQEFMMELPNWHAVDGGTASVVATSDIYSNHSNSYLGKVANRSGAATVWANSVELGNDWSKIDSVTLPDGSPVIGDGLTLFAMGVSGDMADPVDPFAQPTFELSADSANVDQEVTATGDGWPANEWVTIIATDKDGNVIELGKVETDATGAFSTDFALSVGGDYTITAHFGRFTLDAPLRVLEPGLPETGGPGLGGGTTVPTLPETGAAVLLALVAGVAFAGTGHAIRRKGQRA